MESENATKDSALNAQIQRIVQSKTFRASAVHRELLSYLAAKSLVGEADDLKEYTVGIDALGKSTSYDPRQDSSVRMHGARLRQKLVEYYRVEGVNDPVVIDLPKGGFKITFESRPATQPGAAGPSVSGRWASIYVWAAIAAVGVAAAFYLGIRLERSRMPASVTATTELAPELQQMWEELIASDRPLALCLSVPVFAGISGSSSVFGPFSGDWDKISKSPLILGLRDALRAREATPSYDYTNVATATGAFRIGQFLAGRTHNILLTRSDLITQPEIAMDNIIFLGSPGSNPQLQAIPADRQFALDAGGIRDLHPVPGQPALIPDVESGAQTGFPETHALITMAPGPNGAGFILYLVGNNESGITAAVETVTNPAVGRKVFARLKGPDGRIPRYYQLVIAVKSMEEMPIDISYTTHKALSGSSSPRSPQEATK